MNEDQLGGLVSNVKGVLHEMEFVRIENDNGDSVHAAMFEATNHPGTDVYFVDTGSGEIWEAQLKATDNESYVQDWIDGHADGEILITEELADEMGLPSSGLSNEQLTADVESFVDKMLTTGNSADMWDFLPGLSLRSSRSPASCKCF